MHVAHEHGLAAARHPEPQRLSGSLRHLVKDLLDADVAQRLRDMVESPHRDAAAQYQQVVRGEVHGNAIAEHPRIVGQVIVGDTRETPHGERSAQCVGIGAPDLPGLDGLARLHEFVTR